MIMEFCTIDMIDHRKISNYSDLIGSHGPIDVPIEVIYSISDQKYIKNITNAHRAYIDSLAIDINQNGLEAPGILELHLNNILTLQDGNHRLLALISLGKLQYRVILNQVRWSPSKKGIDFNKVSKYFPLVKLNSI